MRPVILSAALLVAPSFVVAQPFDGPRGLVPPGDAACTALQHAWAAGADAPALLGYGTMLAGGGLADPRGSSGSERGATIVGVPSFLERSRERIAVGLDYEGARGPIRWGGAPLAMPVSADLGGPGVRSRVGLSAGPFLAALDVSVHRRSVRWRSVAVGMSTGPVDVLAGRLAVRSGPGCASGLVLAGSTWAGMYGVELRQGVALRLPLVGSTRLGVQLGAMPEGSPGSRWPVFHSMRIELQPHRNWIVGLNRAAMFGGSGSSIDVSPGSVAWMLIGLTSAPGKDSSFENQVASVDVRGRLVVAGRPMLLTLEHATDDSGWGFLRAPAIRVSSELRLSPDVGWAGVAATWMDTGGGWYRNSWFEWGWTDRGRLLGNPLGGEGWSLLGSFRREGRSAAVDLGAGVVRRGARNLFAPALEGTAGHGSARLVWLDDAWEASLGGSADVGRAVAARWSLSILRRFGAGR